MMWRLSLGWLLANMLKTRRLDVLIYQTSKDVLLAHTSQLFHCHSEPEAVVMLTGVLALRHSYNYVLRLTARCTRALSGGQSANHVHSPLKNLRVVARTECRRFVTCSKGLQVYLLRRFSAARSFISHRKDFKSTYCAASAPLAVSSHTHQGKRLVNHYAASALGRT